MLHSSAISFDFRRSSISDKPKKPTAVPDTVRSILNLPDSELDYARVKLTFDGIINTSNDIDAFLANLDQMVVAIRQLAVGTGGNARLAALRKFLHEPGPWNDGRPFEYDHVNCKQLSSKLLTEYVANRLGNCVSMPVLFLILADKLGLDVALARAPSHLFVRYRNGDGSIINLETTSGALPARDIWICQTRHVSQRGIDTGFYMRSLSRREAVGAMATTVLEYLIEQKRFREAIVVARMLSRNDPTDGFSLAHMGNAYCGILKREFLDKYGSAMGVPVPLRREYCLLMQSNHAAFSDATELGWEPLG